MESQEGRGVRNSFLGAKQRPQRRWSLGCALQPMWISHTYHLNTKNSACNCWKGVGGAHRRERHPRHSSRDCSIFLGHVVWARLPAKCFPRTTSCGRHSNLRKNHYRAHFTAKQTEAQRSEWVPPGPAAGLGVRIFLSSVCPGLAGWRPGLPGKHPWPDVRLCWQPPEATRFLFFPLFFNTSECCLL